MDLLDTYQRAFRHYRGDVAQQAVMLTLRRRKTRNGAYLQTLCRALEAGGYHDGLANPESANLWHRELAALQQASGTVALWASPVLRPERVALARDLLRQIPPAILEAALERPFERRGACPHAPKWWYLYRHRQQRSIRCRRCQAQRTQARRRTPAG